MTENKPVRRIRCSSLNVAQECLAALATSEDAIEVLELPPNVDTPLSRLGTAFHQVSAIATAGVMMDSDKVKEVARQYGVDLQELHWLWGRAEIAMGAPDRVWVEEPLTIVVHEGLVITGTLDRAGYYEAVQTLVVDDWKTGRLAAQDDPDAPGHAQLLAYGTGFVRRLQNEGFTIKRLICRLMLVRNRKSTTVTLDEHGIEEEHLATMELATKADLQRHEALISREFCVGKHCQYCRGRGICPAYREQMIQALALYDPPEIDSSLVPLTKKGQPDKRELAKLAKVEIQKRVEAMVRKNPERAFNVRVLANRLHEGLDVALKEYVRFMGPTAAGPDHVLEFRDYDTRGQVTREVVVEAAKFMEIPAGELEKLLDGIDNRPKVPGERFGRYKKQ